MTMKVYKFGAWNISIYKVLDEVNIIFENPERDITIAFDDTQTYSRVIRTDEDGHPCLEVM